MPAVGHTYLVATRRTGPQAHPPRHHYLLDDALSQNKFKPEIAVVQVGADNSHGHPPLKHPAPNRLLRSYLRQADYMGRAGRAGDYPSAALLALGVSLGSALRWLLLSGSLLTLSGLLEE